MPTIRNQPSSNFNKLAESRFEPRRPAAEPKPPPQAARPKADAFTSSFQPSAGKPLVQLQPQVRALAPPPKETGLGGGTPPEPPPAEYLRISSSNGLNMRSGPSTDNGVLTALTNGAIVQVTPDPEGKTREAGWVHVSVTHANGTQQSGWVSEQYTGTATATDAANQQAAATSTASQAELTEADQKQLEAATEIYVNQFYAEKEVMFPTGTTNEAGEAVLAAGDGRNANCGPTSTLIALRDQGLTVPAIPDVTSGGTDGEDIQATRYAMYNDVNDGQDGVTEDADGKVTGYNQTENGTYTGLVGAKRAVEAAGGTAGSVSPLTAEGIEAQIEAGRAVIIAGDFTHEVEVTAEDGTVTTETVAKEGLWKRGGGATDHLVTVTGMTEGGDFILCDPAHPDRKPVVVTGDQLELFMSGKSDAGALWVAGSSTTTTGG
ncbi:MAG TPA: SH3 domain-containing protein [Hyalangium sp.]|nr:SH3 domain-containing protein [Hyalangium sp.]